MIAKSHATIWQMHYVPRSFLFLMFSSFLHAIDGSNNQPKTDAVAPYPPSPDEMDQHAVVTLNRSTFKLR